MLYKCFDMSHEKARDKRCLTETLLLRLQDFQNNLINLDPSYKMDLDFFICNTNVYFWDCFGRKEHHLPSQKIELDILIYSGDAKNKKQKKKTEKNRKTFIAEK